MNHNKFIAACKRAERKAGRHSLQLADLIRSKASLKIPLELFERHLKPILEMIDNIEINRILILGYKYEILIVDTINLIKEHGNGNNVKCVICNYGFRKDDAFLDHFKGKCVLTCPRKFFKKFDKAMIAIKERKSSIGETPEDFPLISYLRRVQLIQYFSY